MTDKTELTPSARDDAARLAQAIVRVVRKQGPRGCEEKYLYTALHVAFAARGTPATMAQIDEFVTLVVRSGLLVRRGTTLYASTREQANGHGEGGQEADGDSVLNPGGEG